MKKLFALLLPLLLASSLPAEEKSSAPARAEEPRFAQRWIWAQYNLLVDKNVEQVLSLIERGRKCGYNGVVLADYKFNVLERLPERYFKNVARVRQAADAAGIEPIPTVCPIGYSAGLLAHDANLAEGLPVKAAPCGVKAGAVLPVPDTAARLRNANLEEVKGDRFAGFPLQDEPGNSTFADRTIVHEGKVSCRMQDLAKHHPTGNCRLAQRVKLRPHSCYRFSCWVKLQDLKPARGFKLLALGAKGGRPLTFWEGRLKATEDWKRVEVVFNSLDENEATLYAGVWGGQAGMLWLDDLRLEELFLVNVLRRDGCPLTVASEDGGTVYEEGKDYRAVRDPRLGQDRYAGEYSFHHEGPALRLTDHSRIKEGDKLRVSWYHPAIVHAEQVMCCLSEPKVYDLLRDQVKRVNDLLKPKTFFLSHDEIRVANWCQACQSRKLMPGALLADNVRRCVKMVKDVNPEAQIVIWSDMFDPNHNAVEHYYLVNGPLTGSWEGLPAGAVIANWNGGKRTQSLKWFADKGHPQIIAGYYDDDVDNFRRWEAAAKGVPGVRGFLYTTWQHRYDHLEAYGKLLQGKE